MPDGFDMSNSPAELAARAGPPRPVILLSSSGTQLIAQAGGAGALYLSCFRNFTATARHISSRHSRVAIIGAGSRGEFREEDQMGCAWLAAALLQAGYMPHNSGTQEVIDRWRGAPPAACAQGNSAKYLRRSGQARDLDFILERIDDVDAVFAMQGEEVGLISSESYAAAIPRPAASPRRPIYDTR